MAEVSTRYAVEVAGLVKSFGDFRAVDGVDLRIPAGSFYGIAGPNGAGKTTSIRMITGLLEPDAGSVTVGGVSVWPNPRAAKQRLGFVPDNPSPLRIVAFALLGVSILLGRFAPEEWTWAGPVAGVCAVVALLTMIVAFIKGRQARRATTS